MEEIRILRAARDKRKGIFVKAVKPKTDVETARNDTGDIEE